MCLLAWKNCICFTCVPDVLRVQKRASDALRLELQTLVSCRMLEINWGPLEEQPELLVTQPSLWLQWIFLKIFSYCTKIQPFVCLFLCMYMWWVYMFTCRCVCIHAYGCVCMTLGLFLILFFSEARPSIMFTAHQFQLVLLVSLFLRSLVSWVPGSQEVAVLAWILCMSSESKFPLCPEPSPQLSWSCPKYPKNSAVNLVIEAETPHFPLIVWSIPNSNTFLVMLPYQNLVNIH